MKKKHFRIYLFDGANSLCDKIAGYAARFNGGAKMFDLPTLETVAKANLIEYPSTNDGVSVHLIGRSLTIDRKQGEDTVCIACIEEVEIFELAKVDEEELTENLN